jgi:hypothetical protein
MRLANLENWRYRGLVDLTIFTCSGDFGNVKKWSCGGWCDAEIWKIGESERVGTGNM